MEKDIIKDLEEILEQLKSTNNKTELKIEELTEATAINLVRTIEILYAVKKGKSLVEASSKFVRSYDDALAQCLKIGAEDNEDFKDNEDFRYDFTTQYMNSILSLVANLVFVKDFAKDDKNRAFLKSKIRECLIYIDML